jgi:hypothetical protein
VVTLGADLKPLSRARYLVSGADATPVKLFTDLHLGFFLVDGDLVLGKW